MPSLLNRIHLLFHRDNNSFGSLMAKGASSSVLLKLGNTGMLFITSVLLARWLGAYSYGEYTYAISWMTLIAVVARMGLDIITPRFISAYVCKQEWSLVSGFFRFSIISIILSSLACMLIAGVIVWLIPDTAMPISDEIFFLSLLLLPITTFYTPFRGYLVSLHKVFKAQLPSLFICTAVFLVLLLTVYLTNSDYFTVYNVFVMQIVATIVGLIFLISFTKNNLLPEVRKVKSEYRIREWLGVAISVSLMGGMAVVNINADILMLGSMRGAESAGIYKVATRGAELLLLASTMVSISLSPVISNLYAAGDMYRLQRGLTKTVRITSLLSLPLLLGLIVFGEWFLSLFGNEFVVGYSALIILCAGMFTMVILGSSDKVLIMTGKERKATLSLVISTLVNLVLNYLLIPPMGIIGAAIATSCSIIVMNVVLVYFVRSSLKLNPTVFSMMPGQK